VCGNGVVRRDGRWYTHHSFGRIVELLAQRVSELHYHAPFVLEQSEPDRDYPLPDTNVVVHPWFPRTSTLHALGHPLRLLRDYAAMVGRGDVLLLRGSFPLIWVVHVLARLRGRRVVHWLVGNPVAVLKAERRGYGAVTHRLGVVFARFEQCMTRLGITLSGAWVLANGAEVARLFRSPRTQTVVSTSITERDIRVGEDTCTGPTIRLLFVGFIRPEKGLEYLIRALPLIQSDRPVYLAVVGASGRFSDEKTRLEQLARSLGCAERVTWEGYAAFGNELFGQIDRSDILVLPSLSEGTPRVLVEARARSVPVISTNVGGIPSSVSDGVDGLLVPPRDPEALARAITRLIADGALRRELIRAGRARVQNWTVERFVELVWARLTGGLDASGDRAED